MNPVLTRFSAAAAVCALVLTGAAVWRALSPPGLDDLRDVTGDRTALDGFSVSLHYGEADRYDSVLTFDSGKAAAPQADYSPLSAHERYLGYINRTISLIRNGRAVRESYQLYMNTELVAQSRSYAIQDKLWFYPDEPVSRLQTLLLGEIELPVSANSNHTRTLSVRLPNALEVPTDVLPPGEAGSGGTIHFPNDDTQVRTITYYSGTHDTPAVTLTHSMALLGDTLYALTGPYDDRYGAACTGEATLCRVDEGAESEELDATVLRTFPVEGRAFLGLSTFSDNRLLLLTRAGDAVVFTLLDADGQTLSEASVELPGWQTAFDLRPAGEPGAALLRLNAGASPDAKRYEARGEDVCVLLRDVGGALTVSGPWPERLLGTAQVECMALAGNRLLCAQQIGQETGKIAYVRTIDGIEAAETDLFHRLRVRVFDLSAGQPALCYEGEAALSVRSLQNPLNPRYGETPEIERLTADSSQRREMK